MSSPSARSSAGFLPGGLRPQLLQALVIIFAAYWVYWPALHGQWLWDDDFYFYRNHETYDPAGLWKIWFVPGILIDYQPITLTVERFEWQWFGQNTFGYHVVNLVLHLVNCFLVWRLLEKLGLRFAWCGGLLFAVHPLMVETVAWNSEIKNTLSLPTLLLSMCCWIDFDDDRSARNYWLAILLFFISMLSKPAALMFPLVLLLYAWWKRSRIDGVDLIRILPFCAITAAFGGLNAWVEHHQVRPVEMVHADLFARVETLLEQTFFLFQRTLIPIDLLPVYPSGLLISPNAAELLLWCGIVAALVAAWFYRRTWGRHVLLGLGFFFINMIPVLVYMFSTTTKMIWSMDHLEYLSIIGVIGLAVAGLDRLAAALPSPSRLAVFAGAAVIAMLMAWGSHAYAAIFANARNLWLYALARNPDSYMVHYNLAKAYADENEFPEAVDEMNKAISLHPYFDAEHRELAGWLAQAGRQDEAIRELKTVIRLNPGFTDAYFDLAGLYVAMGHLPEAADLYLRALRIDPNLSVHDALGNLYAAQNKIPEAMAEYQKSLAMNPNNGEVHGAIGDLYFRTNQLPQAAAEFAIAISLIPGNLKARTDYGVVLARLGRLPEALEQFAAAVQANPDNAGAHQNLGNALLATGRVSDAITEFHAALSLNPGLVQAQQSLARAQQLEGGSVPAPSSAP